MSFLKGLALLFLIMFLSSCADSEYQDISCVNGCEYWEYCNLELDKCMINTDYGFCSDDTDCSEDQICQKTTHKCEIKKSNCEDGCYSWEECIDGICSLKEGRCYWNNDCQEGYYCDTDTKYCVKSGDECNLDCETWEICVNEDGEQYCDLKPEFRWKKFEVEDDKINSRYGLSAFAYDSENENMFEYLDYHDITQMGEASVMGKLDMKTGVQTEMVLMDNDSILADLFFCEEDKEACQYAVYDKETKTFKVLSLDASLIVSLNYQKILKKSLGFIDVPDFSESISTLFSSDAKSFFVYNNIKNGSNNSELYEFSLTDYNWNLVMRNLPNVTKNCMVEVEGKIYSFGGELTYGRSHETIYISKYYIIDSDNKRFSSFDFPEHMEARADMSCAYDKNRNLIYLFGGNKINDEYDEIKNDYYTDLWSFDLNTKVWKKIIEVDEIGTYSPLDEEGRRVFSANSEKPVFGKNSPRMFYDEVNDRLILLGRVPPKQEVQMYLINLSK